MDSCKKLADLPSNYYNDLPFTKYRASKIIKSTGCRKKQFNSDDQFKKFLKIEYIKSYIPMIITSCRENKELRIYLTNEILKTTL